MNKINEDCLCVLSRYRYGKIYIDYVPIVNSLHNDYQELKRHIEDPNSDGNSIYELINSNTRLRDILSGYSYCISLDKAFNAADYRSDIYTLKAILNNIHIVLPDANKELVDNTISYKQNLLEEIDKALFAYRLQTTYDNCKNDKSILAYSHRIRGWSSPQFNLSDVFSVEFKTNYGYGSSSYFYTILKYKGIDILPISDWIHYRYADFDEIILCTEKHELKHESWQDAMELSRDAFNLSIKDEDDFVYKYIINEFDKLATGLENIVVSDTFEFVERVRTFYYCEHGAHDVHDKIILHLKGRELIEFRGSKISGALRFIDIILKFNNIVPLKTYISRIEACNKKIQPVLINEIELIKKELEPLYSDMHIIEPLYKIAISINNDYLLGIRIFDNLINIYYPIHETFYSLNNNVFPQYPEYNITYSMISDYYNKLYSKISILKHALNRLTSYNKIIDEYFAGKESHS